MDKTSAIKKINKVGKIGKGIAIALQVLLGIAAVGVIIGSIALMAIPKDSIRVKFNATANIIVDTASFGKLVSQAELDEGMAEAQNNIEKDGHASVGGMDFGLDSITSDNGKVNIAMSSVDNTTGFSIRKLGGITLTALVYIICAFVSVLFAGKIFCALAKCESPFDADVIKRMQRFAYSLIPWVIIDSVMNSATSSVLFNSSDLSINFNLTMLAVIAMIFVLVYIFKYGAVLQKESDETL